MQNDQLIIENTITYVKKELLNAEGGHDWWHIERVWHNAKLISQTESVNSLVVELAALLHDIADAKFHDGDEEIGPQKAAFFLKAQSIDQSIIDHVEQIIRNISFKGGNFTTSFYSLELAVVQDADRLDAMGAIGIARAFNYGGFKNRELYNPQIAPNLQMSKEEYKKSTAPTINHFYEKLLLLKDRMNTSTGKRIAEKRHHFMEQFLQQFYMEWEGKG
ncbi:HD domain-containing protein [Cytophagaceae bacterium DM2B3-1]|uniref:HD domain-containing protein n=1 Tax=Xanthocytophaga flava TaxID=3048013 RepID=A0ABT7CE32_9BACT|nr:HD domain-containing protein [Xanthocytophaga flavus]MDJ1491984.1 HD domain-containing protein [Xanthocytophaga flavus]